MNPISKPLPWKIKKRVLPQNTDHAGVMWHGAYVSWMEEARIEALKEAGLSYRELSQLGFEMPVVAMEINYMLPLYHGEEVEIHSWVMKRKGVRFPWQTYFFREGAVLVAKSRVDLVVVSKVSNNFRVLRSLPDLIGMTLSNLQNGPS